MVYLFCRFISLFINYFDFFMNKQMLNTFCQTSKKHNKPRTWNIMLIVKHHSLASFDDEKLAKTGRSLYSRSEKIDILYPNSPYPHPRSTAW